MNGTDGATNGFQQSDSDAEEIQRNLERARNDVSQALGEKMLQGWTLLGDQCPRCGFPPPKIYMSINDVLIDEAAY